MVLWFYKITLIRLTNQKPSVYNIIRKMCESVQGKECWKTKSTDKNLKDVDMVGFTEII